MVKVEFSKQALTDLESIYNFIAQDSIKYAKYQINQLVQQTEIIADFPMIGYITPEKNNNNIREIVKGNYRVIYKVHSNKISILTFHHAKKRLKI